MSEITAPAAARDHAEQTSPSNGLKRRQSESGEQGSKRYKADSGKVSPGGEGEGNHDNATDGQQQQRADSANGGSKPTETREARRKGGAMDEKQRSKRLFGSLLGSLNQEGDRVSKRRQEIESRRKAELQRQDDERLEDKQKRLERLREKRREEQEKVNEESMHRRHADMLHSANFLKTKTEPILFYLPWELTARQEDQIDDQVREAQRQIDDELDAFQRSKHPGSPAPTQKEANGQDSVPSATDSEQTNGHHHDEAADTMDTDEQRTNGPAKSTSAEEVPNSAEALGSGTTTTLPPSPGATLERKDSIDNDHMVEGEEDTVIY